LTELLAEWKFNDPSKRELLMLQHAAISGQRQMIKDLLINDLSVDAAEQEAVDEALNKQ